MFFVNIEKCYQLFSTEFNKILKMIKKILIKKKTYLSRNQIPIHM